MSDCHAPITPPAPPGSGHHADGTVPTCPTCEAMRGVPRYPGAWPGDSEPFGHEVTEEDREKL